MVKPLWKKVYEFLTKLKTKLCNPAIPFLHIYQKERKTHVHEKPCIRISIAVLFIIAKTIYKKIKKL